MGQGLHCREAACLRLNFGGGNRWGAGRDLLRGSTRLEFQGQTPAAEGAAAGGAGWFYLFQAGVIEGAGCPAMAGLSIAAKLQDGGCLATVGALHTVWHRHWRELPERKWARLGEARSPVFCTRVYQRPVDYCSFIAAPAARRCTGRGMMVVRGGGSDCR